MLRNYLVVALRNLVRNKFFSALNIFGLAVSMSVCMGIMMLVADQMKYDAHNANRSQIYRVNTISVDNNGVERGGIMNATSPMPLRDELLANYPGIRQAIRIKRGFGNNWLELEGQNVNIPLKGFFADPEVLTFFDYELEFGDPATALAKPYSVVISRAAADKLFKETNPVGQTIQVGDIGTYTVTGVLKETKNKSHLVFEGLASMSTVRSLQAEGKFDKDAMDNWLDFWNGWTYIMLEPGKEIPEVNSYLERIYRSHIAPVPNPDAYKMKFRVQALADITPGPFINNPIGPSLPWAFVYFLGGLALLIMITSCFNFTNLSIARSLKRAREIGVRKVTGAARWQIFTQFICESIVISLVALVVALLFLLLVKPYILQLTFARIFMWDLELNFAVWGVFLAFALVVGIFAGLFPAVVLSGFEPAKVLKSAQSFKLFSRIGLRKALLVSQFALSLIFILTVIVMYNQLNLFLTADYGFNLKKNMIVRLNNTPATPLKQELLSHPHIANVSAVSHVPAAGVSHGASFKKDRTDKDWTNVHTFSVDEDYLKNLEVSLIGGKFFEARHGDANRNYIVINERALKSLRFNGVSDALGQELIHQHDSSRKVIIGVVKDYNHVTLLRDIEPLALMYDPGNVALLQVRYEGSRDKALATIEKSWAKVNPGLKPDIKEVEEEIKFFYNTVFGDLVSVLGVIAGLAIMISCLGLLGMATYSIETRMKEISVRKVMGSSDRALVLLLSRGFLKLIAVSVVIGVPAAWFINNLWLQHITYHVTIGAGTVLVGIAILLLLACVTIGSQTLRAAFTNPIDNLKE